MPSQVVTLFLALLGVLSPVHRGAGEPGEWGVCQVLSAPCGSTLRISYDPRNIFCVHQAKPTVDYQ